MQKKTVPRIAIVDDNLIYQRLIHFQLQQHQMALQFQACNGAACLQQLDAAFILPDLIVLDLEMPVMDGYATARHIKNKWPQIRIIIYSSSTDPDAARRSLHHGADYFAVKMSDIQPLIRLIRKCLKIKTKGIASIQTFQC